jgi:hypothetical protein
MISVVFAPVMEVLPHQLYSCFIGFSPGVAKEHLVPKRVLNQKLCQSKLWPYMENVRNVDEPAGLIRYSPGKDRMSVTQRTRCYPPYEIQIFSTVAVPNRAAFPFHEHDRGTAVRVTEISAVQTHEIF